MATARWRRPCLRKRDRRYLAWADVPETRQIDYLIGILGVLALGFLFVSFSMSGGHGSGHAQCGTSAAAVTETARPHP
jgi:hypothetical protein